VIAPRQAMQAKDAVPERAGDVGEPQPAAAQPSEIVELCAFRVAGEEYVIDLRRIREIIQPLPITPIPRGPEFLEGVMNLRGEAIPVVDVRKRLGTAPAGPRAKVLIVNVAGRLLGLLVDGVAEVMRIPRSAIGPPPLAGSGGPRLFLGVCGARERHSGPAPAAPARLRLLLNVKALLEPAADVPAAPTA
jgi:purine-binding chemotaxis protein CheW